MPNPLSGTVGHLATGREWLYRASGLQTLINAASDVKILCWQRLVRYYGYGATTLILTQYMADLGIGERRVGLFMTLTLLGDVVISLVLTLVADNIGRRKIIGLGSLLMIVSGVVFAVCSNYWLLVAAAVVGVISPSGNEIGPFKAIEESVMAQLVPASERSNILAWYFLLGTLGSAAGSLSCGWLVELLQQEYSWATIDAFRVIFWSYGAIGVIKMYFSVVLSPACEAEKKPTAFAPAPFAGPDEERRSLLGDEAATPRERPKARSISSVSSVQSLLPSLTKESRGLLVKFSALFVIDNLASGLVPPSWISYYFSVQFDTPEGVLGTLFFAARIVSAVSNVPASALAGRLGLVPTMSVTNVLSSVLLGLIPFPDTLALAATAFMLRAITNDMDQAPRQALLAAAFLPEERTAVMGIINVVRTLSQSLGPGITGALAGQGFLWISFVTSAALKLLYSGLLFGMFATYKTREELEAADEGAGGARDDQGRDMSRASPQSDGCPAC